MVPGRLKVILKRREIIVERPFAEEHVPALLRLAAFWLGVEETELRTGHHSAGMAIWATSRRLN